MSQNTIQGMHLEIVPYAAVNAAIFNQDRKILITRRDPEIREGGKWCCRAAIGRWED
ncbi:MAG: hypothetical protein R3B54_16840 [Bdellovibrionota bacterium]